MRLPDIQRLAGRMLGLNSAYTYISIVSVDATIIESQGGKICPNLLATCVQFGSGGHRDIK